MLNETIYAPIQEMLAEVDSLINHTLTTEKYEVIREINSYLLKQPGKRIRPALALLCFSAVDPDGRQDPEKRNAIVSVAAALELIHMASLVHDDILDDAEMRRNMPALHRMFGQKSAIIMGVYLYAQALPKIAEGQSINVLQVIGETVVALCQGEIVQVNDRFNLDISTDAYLTILKEKTGVLFAASCECGVIIAKGSIQHQKQCRYYGEMLGVVFQIADDILDIMGDSETLGKTAGQDIALGEVTLPLIILLNELEDRKREKLKEHINKKDPEGLGMIQKEIVAHTILKKCVVYITHFLNEAESNIQGLNDSQAKDSLIALIRYIRSRAIPG